MTHNPKPVKFLVGPVAKPKAFTPQAREQIAVKVQEWRAAFAPVKAEMQRLDADDLKVRAQ